ncbi:hypothetical protein QN398_26925, partial [Pseudomonas sp. CCC2.2]|nr:hypothetical protein [Pseudomonas sp. CCC2.2]
AQSWAAAIEILIAVVGFPLIKQTLKHDSFASALESFESRVEPAVPWQMVVAYRRYLQQLDSMQGMLASASKIPPLTNLKDEEAG